jgi:hypothetical protein
VIGDNLNKNKKANLTFHLVRGHDGSRPRAVGSLSELINKRGRSVIQVFERMPLAMIINPGHQYLSGFSSRNVPLVLGSVLIECGYKAKNPAVLVAASVLSSPRLSTQEAHEILPCPKTASAAVT